jgi:transaldolase/glucose-6-phosphate isomerase
MLDSGEFQELIGKGISGVTSNPTIFEKAIIGSTDYDHEILTMSKTGKETPDIYQALIVTDIRAAADLLRQVYDHSSGWHGYVSLEVNPALAHDTEGTIKEAKRLFTMLDRPNVMIKVPATPEGIPAIRSLIGNGLNINVTLIFSLEVYRSVIGAYIAGIEDLAENGEDVNKVVSVASFFISRIDTAVDAILEKLIQRGEEPLRKLLGKAAIANASMAYHIFKQTFTGEHFTALRDKGIRLQRPLWASTGTKNPAYSDVMYVENLIATDTVNTTPPATINAFLDHGQAKIALGGYLSKAEQTLAELAEAGISMESIATKLLADGVKAFADSFEKLMAGIEKKRMRLIAQDFT